MVMIRRTAILLSAIFMVLMTVWISTPSSAAHDHAHHHQASHDHVKQSVKKQTVVIERIAGQSLAAQLAEQKHHASQPCKMSWMGDHEHCDACFGSKAAIVASHRLRSEPIIPGTLSKTSPAFDASLLPVPPPDTRFLKRPVHATGRYGSLDDLIVTTGRFRI
jgi:hypothetical protein